MLFRSFSLITHLPQGEFYIRYQCLRIVGSFGDFYWVVSCYDVFAFDLRQHDLLIITRGEKRSNILDLLCACLSANTATVPYFNTLNF